MEPSSVRTVRRWHRSVQSVRFVSVLLSCVQQSSLNACLIQRHCRSNYRMLTLFCFRFAVLWNVYEDCKNYSILPGHQGSITDVHYSADGGKLYTSSNDKSVCAWDLRVGGRIKKLIGHAGIVNTCNPSTKNFRIA